MGEQIISSGNALVYLRKKKNTQKDCPNIFRGHPFRVYLKAWVLFPQVVEFIPLPPSYVNVCHVLPWVFLL